MVARRSVTLDGGVAVLMILAALAVWYRSLGNVDLDAMTDYGLVSVLPVQFYIALLLLTVSFA